MERQSSGRRVSLLALLILLAFGGASWAQLQSGNLYGTILDDQKAVIPGVTVTLEGGGAPQVQVTNDKGQFRFVGLSPGTYGVKAEIEGFNPIAHSGIAINVGRNQQVELTMNPVITGTLVVVTESAPALDTRRVSTGATVTQAELEKIPTSRDPWSILSSAPGVLTDRINVGGNESGQQSNYVGPGSCGCQAVWSVDGMVITDMAAIGSSPAYYDFDSFEEMQVTTGGSDSTMASGGVVLNMVTKRGTNQWKGTSRYIVTDKAYQSDLDFDRNQLGKTGLHRSGVPAGIPGVPATQTPQTGFKQGNRIVKVQDYGFELGGPVVKDRLWVWGAYGRNKVDLLTISDVSDFTDLKSANLKINAQISGSNSAAVFGLNSDKVKDGRNAGPTRPQETTWHQSKLGPDPTAAKIEDTQILGSSFYVTGLFSKVNGGFQLVPDGGTDRNAYLDGGGQWHNTFLLVNTLRPQKQYKADASSFFNTRDLSHELKFGAGRRTVNADSLSSWGTGINLDPSQVGTATETFALARNGNANVKQTFDSVYLQDTVTAGNLTANLGVRYDRQTGENQSKSIQGSALLPGVLPTVSYQGGDIGFDWSDITPRLGLTYALGADRKTLLRASFSRFADQLGTANAGILNPTAGLSFAYLYTTNIGGPRVGTGDLIDLDGDGRIDANDVIAYSGNVDPRTGGLLQSNGVDSDFSAQLTDEGLFSIEHALRPELVVGLNLTYRKIHNIIEFDPLVFDDSNAYCDACLGSIGRRATRSDYEQVTVSSRTIRDGAGNAVATVPLTTPDGKPYTLTYYRLRSNLSTRNGVLEANGGREQTYKGLALTFTKRLADRWMLRGNWSYSDWKWSRVPDADVENPTLLLGGGNHEGDEFLQGSGNASGTKAGVYINSKWSYSVNGLYQIAPDRPWGFNAALNAYGRQGYPVPYFQRVGLGGNEQLATLNVQATQKPDSYRLDDVHMLDARLEKELTFRSFGLTLGVDCFNLFNQAYVLQRNHQLQQRTSDD
ncbi:MAG TPA: carboxypeptidase regulatory-like domain-containing protein, partial [Thermoanaerobaculia bacterium]|nr:carboxypeptidase regulatory-like domain-containing protein [Thermoanaerobaculia bacterium]